MADAAGAAVVKRLADRVGSVRFAGVDGDPEAGGGDGLERFPVLSGGGDPARRRPGRRRPRPCPHRTQPGPRASLTYAGRDPGARRRSARCRWGSLPGRGRAFAGKRLRPRRLRGLPGCSGRDSSAPRDSARSHGRCPRPLPGQLDQGRGAKTSVEVDVELGLGEREQPLAGHFQGGWRTVRVRFSSLGRPCSVPVPCRRLRGERCSCRRSTRHRRGRARRPPSPSPPGSGSPGSPPRGRS